MPKNICLVAVEGATHRFDKPYSYLMSEHTAKVGCFCMVPFGRGDRPRLGIILDLEQGEGEKLKSVMAVADCAHALTKQQIKLCEFVKEQYLCGFFDAVRVVIPLPYLYKVECKKGEYNLVRRKKRDPKPVVTTSPELKEQIILTAEQQDIYEKISPLADIPDKKPALLYGVTASGKTAIFIKLIEQVVTAGKATLLLLPEISLATQMAQRMIELFTGGVALIHSGLSGGERAGYYTGIAEGKYKIVIGTRTAVFAPMNNLGLIIIDEEQDSSYRSDQTPRFSAISVASYIAKENKALLLLASATPSISSYYYAQNGIFHLFELHSRYNNLPLPKAELYDLNSLREAGNVSSISCYLANEIEKNIKNGKQSILLLNRRGYRTVGICNDCREAKTCGSCSVPMVLHRSKGRLLCHYCGATETAEHAKCSHCGGDISYSGFGTEHIEQELAIRFPSTGILRMDTDSVAAKNSHKELLSEFGEHKSDIMVGTQMVAKGLDFEKVTLVGVLSIDSMLYADSYRTYENVFSLVTQVVGRSGRHTGEGKAVIETHNPDNWVLQLAAKQDYKTFYQKELQLRELGLYPPFCSLVMISFVSTSESKAVATAQNFKSIMQRFHRLPQNRNIPLRILGPASYTIATVAGKNRVKLTVKCRNSKNFRDFLRSVLLQIADDRADSGVSIYIDFNALEE